MPKMNAKVITKSEMTYDFMRYLPFYGRMAKMSLVTTSSRYQRLG